MAGKTLFDKLWDAHVVRGDPDGTTLLYIDRHLVHGRPEAPWLFA